MPQALFGLMSLKNTLLTQMSDLQGSCFHRILGHKKSQNYILWEAIGNKTLKQCSARLEWLEVGDLAGHLRRCQGLDLLPSCQDTHFSTSSLTYLRILSSSSAFTALISQRELLRTTSAREQLKRPPYRLRPHTCHLAWAVAVASDKIESIKTPQRQFASALMPEQCSRSSARHPHLQAKPAQSCSGGLHELPDMHRLRMNVP